MADVRFGNFDIESSMPTTPGSMVSRSLLLMTATLLLAWALVVTLTTLQFASACVAGRSGTYVGVVLAAFVLVAGVLFSWLSVDLAFSEILPGGIEFPVTVSVLASLLVVIGAMQLTAMLLQLGRINAAFLIRLMAAFLFVSAHAVLSAWGFCSFSLIWFD